MKNQTRLLSVFAVLAATVSVLSAKPIPGPNGGRILTTSAPHAEFFVKDDHTVTVAFYDETLNPIPTGDREVSVIAQAETGLAKLEFTKSANSFTSTQPLPEGDGYTVVVQIREQPGARPTNHRVVFHDEICEECSRAEYACVCDENDGHDH